MVDVLIDADTIRSPELRHEIPVAVMDPFLYGEHDGAAFAAVSPLDTDMIAAARPDLNRLDVFADLGLRELIAAGKPRHEALRSAAVRNGVLDLTCEELAALVRDAVEGPAVALGEYTVANGPAAASGHGSGTGPIAPGETVIVDLWPQDRATACFTDIARTFVAGRPDPEIVRWHQLVLEAMAAAVASVRPGVTGRELWEQTCDHFEAHGFATQRKPGPVTMDGFPTALGHGVGLEVHEEPTLGRSGGALVAGDVISIEPYLCRAGFGAIQVEDILLVTEDGAERLNSFPQELQ